MIRHATLPLLLALILLPLTGCAARGSFETPARQPLQLTVLTYNIHHGEGTDRKLDLERIAGVIRACEADVVALQEVDLGTRRVDGADQAVELARLTKMHRVYGPAMEFQGGKYGDAILSRQPIVSAATRLVALPWTPGGQREPRVALSAVIGGRFQFISTHLDHTREPSDRLAQAEAINRALAGGSMPAILAGDFNCVPQSPPMAELAKEWTLVSGGDQSFPSKGPDKSIDHVLVRPSPRWRVLESRVIDEPVASDHRPVLVKLELLPEK